MDPVQWIKDASNVLKEAGRVDLSAEILQLSKANIELEKRVMELEGRLRLREQMTWRRNAYWNSNDPAEGPYCSKCADADHKAVRMHDLRRLWKCPACSTTVMKASTPEQSQDFPPPREPV